MLRKTLAYKPPKDWIWKDTVSWGSFPFEKHPYLPDVVLSKVWSSGVKRHNRTLIIKKKGERSWIKTGLMWTAFYYEPLKNDATSLNQGKHECDIHLNLNVRVDAAILNFQSQLLPFILAVQNNSILLETANWYLLLYYWNLLL